MAGRYELTKRPYQLNFLQLSRNLDLNGFISSQRLFRSGTDQKVARKFTSDRDCCQSWLLQIGVEATPAFHASHIRSCYGGLTGAHK